MDLAELYALDAVTDSERAAIDRYISAAPADERSSFLERVRQARETLAVSFTAQEEPPADLFDRIVAQLPSLAQLPVCRVGYTGGRSAGRSSSGRSHG